MPLIGFETNIPLAQKVVLLNAKKRIFAVNRTVVRVKNAPPTAFKGHCALEYSAKDTL
jgi:hypothetical protein